MSTVSQIRRQNTLNVLRKKPTHNELNWEHMTNRIWEIQEICSDIRWMSEDDEILLEVLEDEDLVEEFKQSFGSLAYSCSQMIEEMEELSRFRSAYQLDTDDDEDEPPELFNLFFVGCSRSDSIYAFDDEVDDYQPLTSMQDDYVRKVAQKKLKQLTKDAMIECVCMCMRIAENYLSITRRYADLEAALSVLKGRNEEYLKASVEIEKAYQKAHEATDGFRKGTRWLNEVMELDKMLATLPDRAWVE